jgi:hypothetical protein
VSNAVESQVELYDDIYDAEAVSGQSGVDDILAKRGLLEVDEEDKRVSNKLISNDSDLSEEEEENDRNNDFNIDGDTDLSVEDESYHTDEHMNVEKSTLQNDSGQSTLEHQIYDEGNILVDNIVVKEAQADDANKNEKIPKNETKSNEEMKIQIETLITALETQKNLAMDANQRALASDKECKKLRRNLVKLNADLESAERELEAQRTELDRAATRMEKDRQKNKEEKERLEQNHKEDLKALADEHKASILTLTKSHNDQIEEMEERIQQAEEARIKEGGDIATELTDVIEKEREAMRKVHNLEEERSVCLSQISSLNTQVSALESRVASLQLIADSSLEQEREADDRLDAALSLHARQISQRQSREAELERTIADLSATLVLAKQRETHLMQNAKVGIANDIQQAVMDLKEALSNSQMQKETLESNLVLEQQKVSVLESQLHEIETEHSLEKSSWESKQKEYDDKIFNLTSHVSKLEDLQRNQGLSHTPDASADTNQKVVALHRQVSSLSEELLAERGKLETSKAEVLTLQNRLNAALKRAEVVEATMQNAQAATSNFDLEYGMNINPYANSTRRRHVSRSRQKSTSIRSVLKLNEGRGDAREVAGRFVETIDHLSLELGSMFKHDPIARAIFLLYLILIHTWSFFLIIFHTHSIDSNTTVGPHQLMKTIPDHLSKT